MKIFLNERILISGKDWEPIDTAEVSKNLNNLLSSLNCLNFHVEPTIYYTGNGISRLFYHLDILASLSDYALTNPMNICRVLLQEIDAMNWDLDKKQRADQAYYFLTGGGAVPHYVNNTSVAEATEYKFHGEEVALLNLVSSEFNETNPIHINRSSINLPANIQTFALARIVSDEDMISYSVSHRKNRDFNWNPKHGENGKGMIQNKGEDVSPLECSKDEAKALLPLAISSRKTDELYAYDESVKKFIVFKNENTPNNSYHPYHPINQNEVPEEVRKFLHNE